MTMTEWDKMMWQASYGMCFYHSTWKEQRPATYEAWFDNSGTWLGDNEGPHSLCHTVCDECALEVRVQDDDGLPLIRLRSL